MERDYNEVLKIFVFMIIVGISLFVYGYFSSLGTYTYKTASGETGEASRCYTTGFFSKTIFCENSGEKINVESYKRIK